MQITSDNFSIYLGLVLSALSAVLYVIGGIVGNTGHEDQLSARPALQVPRAPTRWARYACCIAAAAFAYAVIYLLLQILSGARYDLSYVFRHTSPTDPLLYRFSALWAGQEGSMLLWVAICAWAALLIVSSARDRTPLATAFWMAVVCVLGYVLLINDPFARMPQYRSGMVGTGMNPLLRNPWIAIHPPVIFIGYVALMVPAAFAVDAMLRRRYDRWISAALPWIAVGWTLLGAGIAMGMVWSYEVLGWGGYWGWDPVENASLVPWLLSTALIHGVLVQRRTGRLALANRALALSVFLSIFYAAFLTRSGVLSELSVHSFGDGGAYAYWNGIMAGVTAVCLGLLVIRWRGDRSEGAPRKMSVVDKLMVIGIVGLVLFAAAVITGTSLPLVTESIIRPRFYNHLAAPIAGLVVLLTALTMVLGRGLSRASQVAHVGIVLMIIGVLFTLGSVSRSVSLEKNGPAQTAFGYRFSYSGRHPDGPGREVAEFVAERGGKAFAAPVVMEYTEHQAVRFPYVRQGIVSDLYIAPVDFSSGVITPTASVTDTGWTSVPARIPGSEAALILMGMQVEQEMAKLRYEPESGPPVDIEAVKGKPVTTAGYTFEVRRLLVSSSKDMNSIAAGVDVAISGKRVPEKATIEISIKPMVSLVWLGLCLMILGGLLAVVRRVGRRSGAGEQRWATIR